MSVLLKPSPGCQTDGKERPYTSNGSLKENIPTRRRVQNRIAQRNHRERTRSGGIRPKSRRDANELVWIQPQTISRSLTQTQDQCPRQCRRPSQSLLPQPRLNDSLPSDRASIASTDLQWPDGALLGDDDGARDAHDVLGVNTTMASPLRMDTLSSSAPESTDLDVEFVPDKSYSLWNSVGLCSESTDTSATFDMTNEFAGFNALHLASYHGQVKIVRLLLTRRPSDIKTLTTTGQSALHLATAEKQVDTARELLQLGADAMLQDDQGQTALHVAAIVGSLPTARLLLNRRVECLPVRDFAGQTPLHRAVARGHEDVVSLLMERGADPCAAI
ncbi:MAG: hypothetical protein Q9227_008777 [Pyrenula ochraceoflavens]